MIRSTTSALIVAVVICGSAYAGLHIVTPVAEAGDNTDTEVRQQSIESYLRENNNTMPGSVELPDIVVVAG